MGNKLMVAFPLYHLMSTQFFVRWLAMEKQPLLNTIVVDGAYLITSMEIIVDRALKMPDWDRLVVFEHDMIPPVHAFNRIAQYTPEHAVVGSMYFCHDEPHNANVFVEQPKDEYSLITPQTVADWCASPGLYQCGGVGFGFTSIARHVLESWDPDIPMFAMDKRVGSHDLWFCDQAQKQGHKVFVDSGVVCDHLTTVPIGLSHNQACAHMIDDAEVLDFSYAGS